MDDGMRIWSTWIVGLNNGEVALRQFVVRGRRRAGRDHLPAKKHLGGETLVQAADRILDRLGVGTVLAVAGKRLRRDSQFSLVEIEPAPEVSMHLGWSRR